jgi:hypothetical protein
VLAIILGAGFLSWATSEEGINAIVAAESLGDEQRTRD